MSNFEHLGIQPWLAKQCEYMALTSPTPIQQQCIPAILEPQAPHAPPRNIVGGAATGSGKTAAFALPILQLLSADMYGVYALVLTPSRELAYQIVDQFVAFGAPLRIRVMLAIGGVRHEDQVDALKGRPHVVVATPGRLCHLFRSFERETRPAFHHLRFLVLDEADRLTEGDLQADVRELLQVLPPKTAHRQTLMFSATIQPRLTTIVEAKKETSKDDGGVEEEESILSLLGITDPASLKVFMASETAAATTARTEGSPAGEEAADAAATVAPSAYEFPSTLEQCYVFMPNMVKLPNLVAALRARGKEQSTIVFVNSCQRAEIVRLTLQLLGFPVSSLDSLLTQQQRLDHLALFKLGLSRILVCTDIAARGLDIPNVELVLHYDVPKHAETYVHRVGRTARAGRAGTSVAFVTEYDVALIQRIEKKVKVRMAKWKEKALQEERVVRVLEEVSAAKIQAKEQVMEQYQNRVSTLKSNAQQKKMMRAQHRQRQQQQQLSAKRDYPTSLKEAKAGAQKPIARKVKAVVSSSPRITEKTDTKKKAVAATSSSSPKRSVEAKRKVKEMKKVQQKAAKK